MSVEVGNLLYDVPFKIFYTCLPSIAANISPSVLIHNMKFPSLVLIIYILFSSSGESLLTLEGGVYLGDELLNSHDPSD